MKIKKVHVCLVFSIAFASSGTAQNTAKSLNEWHDSSIGRENLPVNNGYLYSDFYLTAADQNPFFKDKNYDQGSVKFEGQLYDNLHLNYDIYKDLLLLKANGAQDLRAVSIIKSKTDFFIFKGTKFLNLSNADFQKSVDVTGFYEETAISPAITLLTKHSKSKSEKIQRNQVVSEFSERKQFLILRNNAVSKYAKNELLELYPNLKTEINSFYSDNSKLEKSDEQQFIENLLTRLEMLSK